MASAKGTRERILNAANALVRSGGPGNLTFDAVAGRLGVSKQAVLYWFPRKEDLVAAVALPCIRDEAQAALAAIEGSRDAASAVRAFVGAVAAFHFADMDRFRLMYIAPQLGSNPLKLTDRLGDQVHALTTSMYDALQEKMAAANGAGLEVRRSAVAIHMAVLGLVMMVSLTDRMGDPLLHDRNDLVDALAGLLSA